MPDLLVTLNVVITTLLTSQPDPQRGIRLKPEQALIAKWVASVKGGEAVILADEFEYSPPGQLTVRVPAVNMNVYFRRWLHIWQYLRDNPQSEPKTYADSWAKQNHPERIYQEFIEAHRGDVMLNAGLLGGTRADVMAFAHGIIRLYYRIESYRFWKKEQAGAAVGDMLAFGIVAQSFADRLVTGPLVHTVFKTDGIGKEAAWWKHK